MRETGRERREREGLLWELAPAADTTHVVAAAVVAVDQTVRSGGVKMVAALCSLPSIEGPRHYKKPTQTPSREI